MTRIRTGVLGLAAAAMMLVAACGAPDDKQDAGQDGAPPESGQQAAPDENKDEDAPKVAEELRFTAKTIDGKPFSGEDLAGKPAVLWFWTPWCPTCAREAPGVAAAAADHPEVTFVGVAAQDRTQAMRDFADQYGVDAFTNIDDENSQVWAKFGVTYQPAFAFIDADGKVDVVRGAVPEDELTQRLDSLAGA